MARRKTGKKRTSSTEWNIFLFFFFQKEIDGATQKNNGDTRARKLWNFSILQTPISYSKYFSIFIKYFIYAIHILLAWNGND